MADGGYIREYLVGLGFQVDSAGLEAFRAALEGAQQAAQLTRAAKRRLFIDIPGNGILLTVPLKSVAGGKTLAYLTNDCKTGGTPHMEFKHELIVVILNEGYADFVMDAARAAGAGGGTVIKAKGTGAEYTEKFFGFSIASEKEIHLLVTPAQGRNAIMKAIMEQAGLESKAQSIVFSLPVSHALGLRQPE